MTATFAVSRDDLRRTHWIETPAPPLASGQARLHVDRFALTSNNITYGAFGAAMNYWDFFPTGDANSGCIPVWGFATVGESTAPGLEVGDRFYGYLPMADEVVVTPEGIDERGFVDGSAHRRELHALYNRYHRCRSDPLYRADHEALIALLRPLFATSFLIDDFLADAGFFGATTVLVASASSKTAYGLAFCLSQRRGAANGVSVVGLTSPANHDFTTGLGCYDEVVVYRDLDRMGADNPAVYVDMSGSATLRASVHRHWKERLAYSCSVGGTHWDDLGSGKGLPGPRPQLFFAPAQAEKRVEDWGGAELQRRLGSAWLAFIERVSNPAQPWLRVVAGRGRADIEGVYAALLDGRVPAVEGHVLAV